MKQLLILKYQLNQKCYQYDSLHSHMHKTY